MSKKETNKGVIILCLYFDDLLIMGGNEDYTGEFMSDLMKEFEMKDLGDIAYFLVFSSGKLVKDCLCTKIGMHLKSWRNLKWNGVMMP